MRSVVQLPHLDSFHIHECLGRGGMGAVYSATTDGGLRVALKVIAADGIPESAARSRFQREIAALSSIHHPNVVKLVGAGVADGVPYAVLERAQGDRLDRIELDDLEEIIAVARQLASALACVHAAGWLHRDVKPANVMVARDGHVTLLDFGLAKHVDDPNHAIAAGSPVRDDVSVAGTVCGTKGYMAPEVLRGQPTTPASDVYALGLVMREIVARGGVRPPSTFVRAIDEAASVDAHRRPSAAAIAATLEHVHAAARDDHACRTRWDAYADVATVS